MKAFLKENFIYILILIFAGLVFILWGRVIYAQFAESGACENLSSTEARVRCLESFGWEVDETSETLENVFIPEKLDDVYKRYNKIQKLSGFDLEKYTGKAVKRYTFRALNFPNSVKEEVFVNILVFNGKLIGGDCMTVALDGFMLPLDRRFID